MIEDTNSTGFIHQWTLVGAEPRCLLDAIPPTDPDAAKALGRNAAIRDLIDRSEIVFPEETPAEVAAYLRIKAGEAEEGDEEVLAAYLDDAEPIDPVLPVPEIVSRRQFYQACARAGLVTPEEALAAVKVGEIPAALDAIVSGLEPHQQFDAEMMLAGAVEFRREHPLTNALGVALGWSAEDIDDLFRSAADL